MKPKILAFGGSLRQQSWNQQLAHVAADAADAAGADVTVIKLADYPLPLFSEDIEHKQPAPEGLVELRKLLTEADGLLIASPEYNGSLSAVLKNTLDWLSRASEDKSYTPAFGDKVIGILSASPGSLGGIRSLSHLRDVLTTLGGIVLPGQVAIPAAYQAFDANGSLVDDALVGRVNALAEKVVNMSVSVRA